MFGYFTRPHQTRIQIESLVWMNFACPFNQPTKRKFRMNRVTVVEATILLFWNLCGGNPHKSLNGFDKQVLKWSNPIWSYRNGTRSDGIIRGTVKSPYLRDESPNGNIGPFWLALGQSCVPWPVPVFVANMASA